MSEHDRHKHASRQKSYFDSRADFFRQPVPDDIQARTRKIVEAARLTPLSHVLDVGTGLGVLIGHLIAAGVQPKNIAACDLSEVMLAEARLRYPETLFWQGDFIDFPETFGAFDAIFFNACFGNFYDQNLVIERTVRLLSPGGRLVISHPMGAGFVAQLNAAEPAIVPYLLPDRHRLDAWQALYDLKLELYTDELDLYIAVLRKGG